MTGKTQSVKIRIQDEEYTIRSDAAPDHTRAVAVAMATLASGLMKAA